MPLFNRKPQAADANTATAVGSNDAPTTEKTGLKGMFFRRSNAPTQERAAYGNDNLNARPRFGQWLKGTVGLMERSNHGDPANPVRSST